MGEIEDDAVRPWHLTSLSVGDVRPVRRDAPSGASHRPSPPQAPPRGINIAFVDASNPPLTCIRCIDYTSCASNRRSSKFEPVHGLWQILTRKKLLDRCQRVEKRYHCVVWYLFSLFGAVHKESRIFIWIQSGDVA